MANIKITDLSAYSDPESTDVLPIVDITNDATKKVSIADLMENAGAGAEATPGIAFDGDPDTGIYRPAANQLAFSTGGTQRILIDDSGVVTVAGDLTVNGTTTTVNSTTVTVDDKNIELGSVGTPTDTTADGGGITLKGATDKTLNWVNSTDSWTSSENVDLASGKTYKIAGTDVLSATALGSAVQISSDNIPSGTIVNDDVNASAAIAGTKIDPDFGSQTVETTGVFSAAGGAQGTPSITFTGDLNTGIYSPGADQVAISTGGSGRLFVDASGQVGVGTSSPGNPLEVAGAIETSGSSNAVLFAGSSSTPTIGAGIHKPADDSLAIVTGSSERLRIDSSGRLLIGTSTARSDFFNSTTVTPVFQIQGTGNNRIVSLTAVDSSSASGPSFILAKSRSTGNTVVQSADSLGNLSFQGSDGSEIVEAARIAAAVDGTPGANDMPGRLMFSTTADGASSPTERMRIDSSGRVGVGTTSPSNTLDIGSGNIEIGGGNNTALTWSSDVSSHYLKFTTALNGLTLNGYGGLAFETNGANERMRIDSSGRVGVGTSSPVATRFSSTADGVVNIAGTKPVLYISETDITNGAAFIGKEGGNTFIGSSGDGAGTIQFQTGTDGGVSTKVTISAAGNLGVGTTSPSTSLQVDGSWVSNYGTVNITGPDNGLMGVGLRNSSTYLGGVFFRDGTAGDFLELSAQGSRSIRAMTNGSEALRIDSSGRVGIGTSSPGTGTSGNANQLVIANAGSSSSRGGLSFFNGNAGVGSIYFADTDSSTAGGIEYNHSANSMEFRVNDGVRAFINSSGNVGIGTTSPNKRLTVAGDTATGIRVSGSTQGGAIEFDNNGSLTAAVGNIGNILSNSDNGLMLYASSTNTIRFAQGANERARIDSSGRLLVGTSSSRSVDNEKILQIEGVNQQSSSMSLTRNTNSSAPPNISFGKSRGSTLGSNTIVQSGDSLGVIVFCGADGSDTNSIAAAITGQVDGTPGSNDMPGRLVFSTTPSSGSSPTERLRIDREGNSIFGSAGTLNSSDTVGIIPSEGRITFGMNGRSSLVTGESACYIFSGSGSTGTFPAGNLILQSRSNVSRSIQFATGSTPTVRMTILGSGAVNIAGSLSKGSGSFKIDHPLPEKKETHHLVHSFIEGPQADLIYRGKVELSNGAATVNLDTAARMTEGTFVLLNTNVQCFTSNESDWTAVRGSVSGNILTIAAEDNTSTATVSWLVIGERKDEHMLDTDWTDENGRVITEPLKETELVSEDPEAN